MISNVAMAWFYWIFHTHQTVHDVAELPRRCPIFCISDVRGADSSNVKEILHHTVCHDYLLDHQFFSSYIVSVQDILFRKKTKDN